MREPEILNEEALNEEALHEDWRARVKASFAGQGALHLIGAELVHLAPGEADVALPFREDLGQHLGFFHGGVIAMAMDVACGMAAMSRMAPGQDVLTAEFKLNFLAPAQSGTLIARGRVVQAGRTLTVCTGEGWVGDRQVALMQATMAAVRRR